MIIAIFYAGRTVPKKAGWCGSVEEEGGVGLAKVLRCHTLNTLAIFYVQLICAMRVGFNS